MHVAACASPRAQRAAKKKRLAAILFLWAAISDAPGKVVAIKRDRFSACVALSTSRNQHVAPVWKYAMMFCDAPVVSLAAVLC